MLGGVLAAGAVVERLGRRHPLLRVAGTALATWTALGGAALAADGTATARALDASDLAGARAGLRRLSAHDPATLDGVSVARVAVEAVAENTSDAVVAPLWWGAVAGVPGLLAYQAVRALDGCDGTSRLSQAPARPQPLRRRWFGWIAARLDDLANLVPSRLTAVLTAACAPVVGGSAPDAWEVWRRDGSAHPRPNHGQVEAAFAGALQVRLGGRTAFPAGVQERPVLGHGRTPDAGDLTRGVELSRVVGAAAAVASAVVAVLVGARR
jgi:adenosylcobinamide-phosphate synthase